MNDTIITYDLLEDLDSRISKALITIEAFSEKRENHLSPYSNLSNCELLKRVHKLSSEKNRVDTQIEKMLSFQKSLAAQPLDEIKNENIEIREIYNDIVAQMADKVNISPHALVTHLGLPEAFRA